jgi:hypothetical protein
MQTVPEQQTKVFYGVLWCTAPTMLVPRLFMLTS